MSNKILFSAGAAVVALTSLAVDTVQQMPKAIAQRVDQQAIAHHTPSHRVQGELAQAQTLKIAFPNRGEATEAQRKADAVANFLSQQLKMPVEAVVSDETAAVEALRANRVDVAFLSSRPALKAQQLAGARLALAEVRPGYSGGHTYRSVMVVRKNSPLRTQATPKATLAQLRGKRMAFASKTSGSGYIVPTGQFVGFGFVPNPDRYRNFFKQVTYGDGYSSALKAVLRGQADVGAVSEYALGEPYITKAEASQLRVLYYVGGVPAHGIAIDNDVSATTRNKIVQAMLKLNQPANNKLLKDLTNATKLVSINHDQHLARMRSALKQAKIAP
ncbi:MAG TPA: phosphate/phosphite/phosphonate ABC transporter substrate-binding protein [Oculatellaceae cyanobacterium]